MPPAESAHQEGGHVHAGGDVRFCPQCGGPLAVRQVEHRERPVCPACGFVWYHDPKVAACTIPILDGRVVLVRRAINPARGQWVFPGGYMDRGETVEEAAVRETWEETGLAVRLRGLTGVYSYRDTIVVVVVFAADVVSGEACAGSECLEVKAFAPAELPWDGLAFHSTQRALRDWLGGQP